MTMARLCGIAFLMCFPCVTGQARQAWCSVWNCGKHIGKCALDGGCRARLKCSASCFTGPEDALAMCISGCNVKYPSEKADAMTTCLNEHDCVPMPFPMDDTCHPPPDSKVLDFNMSTIERGSPWWVIYGNNPTADCHGCQRRQIHPVSDTEWMYDYTLQLQTSTEPLTFKNWTLHTPLTVTPEQKTSMKTWVWPWGDVGLYFVEQWWVLDTTPDYLQVYYCCYSQKDRSKVVEGGLILAPAPKKDVPEAALKTIGEKYAAVGVDFSKYCKVDNSCAGAPSSDTLDTNGTVNPPTVAIA